MKITLQKLKFSIKSNGKLQKFAVDKQSLGKKLKTLFHSVSIKISLSLFNGNKNSNITVFLPRSEIGNNSRAIPKYWQITPNSVLKSDIQILSHQSPPFNDDYQHYIPLSSFMVRCFMNFSAFIVEWKFLTDENLMEKLNWNAMEAGGGENEALFGWTCKSKSVWQCWQNNAIKSLSS